MAIKTQCTYNVDRSRLWNAITHPQEMRKWFFESMHSFIPEYGFSTRFKVKNKGKNYVHLWRIVEVVPEQKISYEWRYDNYPGKSLVGFELFKDHESSKLIVTHSGTETFPQDNPDFISESFSAGWNYFLCVRLKSYLALSPDLKISGE